MAFPGGPGVPELTTAERLLEWARILVGLVRRIYSGGVPWVAEWTLTANAASTVMQDARISYYSFIGFDAMTANAAAEIGAGTMYITSANRTKGQVTITHANNAQTDRTFRVLIVG